MRQGSSALALVSWQHVDRGAAGKWSHLDDHFADDLLSIAVLSCHVKHRDTVRHRNLEVCSTLSKSPPGRQGRGGSRAGGAGRGQAEQHATIRRSTVAVLAPSELGGSLWGPTV